MSEQISLKRSLTLPLLVLYGLGTTIGAGIFALLGKVTGQAGLFAPFSFLLASILASFTAFSFAELAARLPRSAGEALYVREGLRSENLSKLVGLLVAMAGTISSAAITNGAVGYVKEFTTIPDAAIIVPVVVVLGLIAVWGIAESVTAAALLTLVEVGVLLFLIWIARDGFATLPLRWGEFLPHLDIATGAAIFAGAFLAFYAFLGFEDMVNVAEEVKNVTRIMPLGIILTLIIAAIIYVTLALAAVLTVSPGRLAASDAPLILMYETATGSSPVLLTGISILAIMNGALIQIIMASRVLYGMSSQGQLPAWLGQVGRHTRTPVYATVGVTAGVLVLALWLPIEKLASATSFVALSVFALVNLALWRLKRRDPRPEGLRVYPIWIPITGFLASLLFLVLKGVNYLTG